MISDNWKHLRAEICFGNEEPIVELVAYTDPVGRNRNRFTEELPAFSAAVSYGTEINSLQDAQKLNRKLIERLHHTPLESVQYNFYISGISKICGAQLSRHRIGQGHVSSSRRFRQQEMSFIYPMLNYLKDEREVSAIYTLMSESNQRAFEQYLLLKGKYPGIKKSDVRYIIPASTASQRHWWINARALRDFLHLRLAPDAESEIRRLAGMVLVIAKEVTPTLFEDIVNDI